MAVSVQEKQLHNLIKKTILESVQEISRDPDAGRALNPHIARRLKKYQSSPSRARSGIFLKAYKSKTR